MWQQPCSYANTSYGNTPKEAQILNLIIKETSGIIDMEEKSCYQKTNHFGFNQSIISFLTLITKKIEIYLVHILICCNFDSMSKKYFKLKNDLPLRRNLVCEKQSMG